tara:strand:- start:2273 stop:2446 length:174 start_codon:yes stop_codon:yes gene_type:complete
MIKIKCYVKNVENSKNGINELDDKNKVLYEECDVKIIKTNFIRHTKIEKYLKNIEKS